MRAVAHFLIQKEKPMDQNLKILDSILKKLPALNIHDLQWLASHIVNVEVHKAIEREQSKGRPVIAQESLFQDLPPSAEAKGGE
jgi:hypothetical protein